MSKVIKKGLNKKFDPEETNSSVFNKIRRLWLKCSRCPPHRADNKSRHVKHGEKKPKYKDHV
jgi:hypothetical protein